MRTRLALALLLCLSCTDAAQGPGSALSALVKITGHRQDAKMYGSGFVVGLEPGRATIVTAAHVIEGVDSFEVRFAADSSKSYRGDRVLRQSAVDPNGLAVLQVGGSIPAEVTVLAFDVEARPLLGDALYLLGFPPLLDAPRVKQGVLSGRDGNLLLVDQVVAEGFSGGPVLREGKVVGVVSSTPDQETTQAVNALVAQGALEGWGIRLGARDGAPVESPMPPTAPPPMPTEPAHASCESGEVLPPEKGITYVRICPGSFAMGSAASDGQAFSDETPAHPVTVSELWLARTETTNAQYRRFRPDHAGDPALPATEVSWEEAEAACQSFGGRLPTEAEWEYAARAGSRAAWSFGADENRLGRYAWYSRNSDGQAHPVGTKRANAWGLFDMHGNVWEWVADWSGTYFGAAQTDPRGPATGTSRVLRGGAFDGSPGGLRSAFRGWNPPALRGRGIGFRCARDPRREP